MRIFAEQAAATEKMKGYAVRTLMTWIMNSPEDAKAPPPVPVAEAKEEPIVQAGDFSVGVDSVLGGMAKRWASKKVQKKVDEKLDQKMKEHPAWVDDIKAGVDGANVPFAELTQQSQLGVATPDASLFEIPKGYKQVKEL